MEKGLIVLMVLVLWGPAMLYVGYRLIKMFNAPGGERLARQVAHGPFVPVSKEEFAEDDRVRLAPQQAPQH